MPPILRKLTNVALHTHWRTLTLGVLLLVAFLLGTAWMVTLNTLEHQRQARVASVTRQQEDLAIIVSEHFAQVLDRARVVADSARPFLQRGNVPPENRQLLAMPSYDPAILRVALYDRTGRRLLATTSTRDPAQLAPVESVAADYALPPAPGFAQSQEISLAFPIRDEFGQVNGTLLAVLDSGYFLSIFRHIDIGPTGTLRLLTPAGRRLAEATRTGMSMLPLDAPPFDLPPRQDGLSATEQRTIDGTSQLVTFRQLAGHPYAVNITRELGDIEATERQNRHQALLLLGGVSLLLVLAAAWILVGTRRHGLLVQSLEDGNLRNIQLIVQLEEEKTRAAFHASHDHLTGLYNRRMFEEIVGTHLLRAKRSPRHYALLFIDLDRFKPINDTYGHHVGDEYLKGIAERITHSLRESDIVARLGGDEFGVLLTALENPADAERVVKKLLEQIAATPIAAAGHAIPASASIGVAIYPRDGIDYATLCQNADHAMYAAKQQRRGSYALAPEKQP